MNLLPLDEAAIKAEYEVIADALKKTGFDKKLAAQMLGIDRKTLYNKIKAYRRLILKEEEQKVA